MPVAARTDNRTTTAPTTLEAAAKDYRELLTAINTMRPILAGSEWARVSFQVLDGKVVKTALWGKSHPISYRFADRHVEAPAPEIDFSLSLATEQDLLNAREMAPTESAKIDVLLRTLREGQQPEKPMRIEIVNPKELHPPDRVISIKRDDSGKMSHAIQQSIT